MQASLDDAQLAIFEPKRAARGWIPFFAHTCVKISAGLTQIVSMTIMNIRNINKGLSVYDIQRPHMEPNEA